MKITSRPNTGQENYEELLRAWEDESMQSFKDFLTFEQFGCQTLYSGQRLMDLNRMVKSP